MLLPTASATDSLKHGRVRCTSAGEARRTGLSDAAAAIDRMLVVEEGPDLANLRALTRSLLVVRRGRASLRLRLLGLAQAVY